LKSVASSDFGFDSFFIGTGEFAMREWIYKVVVKIPSFEICNNSKVEFAK
jgi:hypothetical protein